MNPIDYFLNRMSMYRLVLTSLWVLAWISFAETFLGWVPYTPIDLILSLAILLFTARATSALCVLFTRAAPAPESASITALLLFFILTPLQSAGDALLFIIAAALAVLSKYVLSVGKRALFNAAAFGAFALSLAGSTLVSWWVGTLVLLPFVLIAGFFIVRKTRQERLFWTFVVTAFVLSVGKAMLSGVGFFPSASALITISPLVFVGTFMLLDPHTIPTQAGKRSIYGILVGILYSVSFSIPLPFGAFASSPELALLVGNVYAFFVERKNRVALSFHAMTKLSRGMYEFAFVASEPLEFAPGQYAEISAPHAKADDRGIRRYMALSSPPGDHFVRFATRVPVESSTFKDVLRDLKKDDQLSASAPFGALVLPSNPDQKIFMIAAGVGITPFMSIFRHLALQHERRDMVLIYAAETPLDFAYQEEIDAIKDSIGLRVIYLPTDFSELSGWNGPSGYLTPAFVEKEIRDYKKRHWLIAGPTLAVQTHEEFARLLGIESVVTEAFPGF